RWCAFHSRGHLCSLHSFPTRRSSDLIPTAGAMDDAVRHVAGGADLLFFDGTFWSDDELTAVGVAAPTAREMGHLPIGGPGGSLEDRKSTRLNSSHQIISYAVFCLKKT